MINVDILDTTYQYIITTFLLNTILHHVCMLWIIETHEQLQYDMDENNSEWMTGGPCHIVIVHAFQLSVTYKHGVILYSIKKL